MRKVFENPGELWDYFCLYISDCIDAKDFPNFAGFRRFLHIPRSTYIRYEKKDDYCNVFELILDALEDETLQDTRLHPTTKKLYMQNKFNYVDSQKVESNNVTVTQDISMFAPEERKKRIEELRNKLGEGE